MSYKIAQWFYEPHYSGIGKHTLDIISNLNRELFEPIVIAPDCDEITLKKLEELNIKYYAFKMNKYFSSSAITNFKYIVQTENIKLLHIHSMEAGWGGHLAAKLAGLKPVVFTPQTTSFTKKWLKSIYYNIWRLYGNWTSKLIAVSTQQEAEMWQYRFVNKREKIITIYNGVNITQLEKLIKEKDRENNEIIKMLGVNTDAPIIGYMGRFSWQKDPFNFVKAAKIVLEKYPKVQFVMVGNGILKENTITLNGSNASAWADKSGNGNDLSQTNSLFQPDYT